MLLRRRHPLGARHHSSGFQTDLAHEGTHRFAANAGMPGNLGLVRVMPIELHVVRMVVKTIVMCRPGAGIASAGYRSPGNQRGRNGNRNSESTHHYFSWVLGQDGLSLGRVEKVRN